MPARGYSFPLITAFKVFRHIRYIVREREEKQMQIDCVIKNTKTVEEFKRVREDMLKRAERYSRKHIASCENWQEGFPVKCWRGAFGVLWIEYESGHCWQYRETASGLEWW